MNYSIQKITRAGQNHNYDDNKNQDIIYSCEYNNGVVVGLANGYAASEFTKAGGYACLSAADRALMAINRDYLAEDLLARWPKEQADIGNAINFALLGACEALKTNQEVPNHFDMNELAATMLLVHIDLNGNMLGVNLGDNSLRCYSGGRLEWISSPDPAASFGSTFVTTSKSMTSHLRPCIRKLTRGSKLILSSDGAEILFRDPDAASMLLNGDFTSLGDWLDGICADPSAGLSLKDDCSCILISVF